jgi:murein DD-endopeptidase MepM/ murein hydrolase activator NlpD
VYLDVVPFDVLFESFFRYHSGSLPGYIVLPVYIGIALYHRNLTRRFSKRLEAIERKYNRMFPLTTRSVSSNGYRFGDKTFYSAHHLGVDYEANNDALRAPSDGSILESFWGTEGGLTIWFRPVGTNLIMRFLHLSVSSVKKGQQVRAGELIGITGNTGKLSKGPHLHLDISIGKVVLAWPGNFIDPEGYDWGGDEPVPVVEDPWARTEPTETRPNGYVQTRVKGIVNVRVRCDRLSPDDVVEKLHDGEIQDVAGLVEGVSINGNNQWFVKPNGYFIWTGGTGYNGTI